jgi:hypothetical protein
MDPSTRPLPCGLSPFVEVLSVEIHRTGFKSLLRFFIKLLIESSAILLVSLLDPPHGLCYFIDRSWVIVVGKVLFYIQKPLQPWGP